MAQAITVQPIVTQQDDSWSNFNQAIALRSRQRQEMDALRFKAEQDQQRQSEQLRIEQARNNAKIFGDSVQNLTKLFTENAANLPQEVRDRGLSEAISQLIQAQKDNPESLQYMAPLLVSGVSSKATGIKNYFDNAAKTISELKTQGFDPGHLMAVATKNLYDETDNSQLIDGLQKGTIQPPAGVTVEQAIAQASATNGHRTYKNVAQLGDISEMLKSQAFAHPEIFADKGTLNDVAYEDLKNSDLFKGKKAGDKKSFDPTGSMLKFVGTDYTMNSYNRLEVAKDPVTGLEYKRPVLDLVSSDKLMLDPNGKPYMMLADDKFNKLIESKQSINNRIKIGALDEIRDHNEQVFVKLGYNPEEAKDLSLSISANNALEMSKRFPGIINPFDKASNNVFQKIYGAKFLLGSSGYKDNGEPIDFQLDNKVDRPKPPTTIVNIGTSGGVVGNPAYQRIQDITSKELSSKAKQYVSVNSYPTSDVPLLLQTAQSAMPGVKFTADQLGIKIDPSTGRLGIYAVKPITQVNEGAWGITKEDTLYSPNDSNGGFIIGLDESLNVEATKGESGTKLAGEVRANLNNPKGKGQSFADRMKNKGKN